MSDGAESGGSFSEVSHQSWFQRMGNAIAGVLIGIVLFFVAFPVLWWNEGRAVKTAKGLAELGSSIVSVQADKVEPQNDKKPVHVVAEATTSEALTDPVFPISEKAIKLRRKVEMFQWKEDEHTETHNRVGGGTEKRTTYTYKKVWSDSRIDSGNFHRANDHANPREMRFRTIELVASDVKLGAYRLSPSLVSQINSYALVPVGDSFRDELPTELQEQLVLKDSQVYFPNRANKKKADPVDPAIGDVRITFDVVKPTTVSVAAQQFGNSFEPWRSHTGTSIERLMVGTVSSDQMVSRMQTENTIMTWVLRLAGFVVMGMGVGMVLNPMKVMGDVIPFIGSIVGMGIGLVSMVTASFFSLMTIALAWVFYRPLIGILLMVAALGIVVLFRMLRQPKNTGDLARAGR